jgi:hypothetical protein
MSFREAEIIDFRERAPVRAARAEVIRQRSVSTVRDRADDDLYIDLNRHGVALIGAAFAALMGLATGAWLQI